MPILIGQISAWLNVLSTAVRRKRAWPFRYGAMQSEAASAEIYDGEIGYVKMKKEPGCWDLLP